MRALLLIVITGYKKYVSPFLPRSCRFEPSCSRYCIEAVERYGVMKGMWLFARRIVKCHPFHPGGYDPVEHLDNPF